MSEKKIEERLEEAALKVLPALAKFLISASELMSAKAETIKKTNKKIK